MLSSNVYNLYAPDLKLKDLKLMKVLHVLAIHDKWNGSF